jgi:tryptophan 2,3-dioxygenase
MTFADPPAATPSSIDDLDMTYGSYLQIPELLSLQHCRSVDPETGRPEHDETLFIIIHQVYELWFKQLLHELDFIIVRLCEHRVNEARHHLKRVLKILKTLVGQIDVLETMTPVEFASFRAFLANASGFQSAQFRELEFTLGIKDRVQTDWFLDDDRERLLARYEAPTLWDAFVAVLAREGYDVPDSALRRNVQEPIVENPDLQRAIIASYTDEGFAGLCETLTDLDEGLQEWRYRHVMMVRRTIGTKPGTGGSDGASYLASTLFRPAFPDLWAIRTAF